MVLLIHCAQFLQLFFPDLSFRYGDRVFTTYLFCYLAGCYVGQQCAAFVAALDLQLAAGVSSIGTQFALHLAVVYSVVPALCILWQSGFSAVKSKLKTDRKGTTP